MRFIGKVIVVACLVFSVISVRSQQVNTTYFMENAPERNILNPAFQPSNVFYFGLPVIGYSQIGLGNNSISLKDVIYNNNGQTIMFYNPNGNKQNFYDALSPVTMINENLQINLLDFGFRSGKSFWTFSLTEKMDREFSIPKDLIGLAVLGTPQLNNNIFDLSKLDIDMSTYTEAAFGYSRKLSDKFTIGAKLKFLYGSSNISTTNQNISINAGVNDWKLKGTVLMNTAAPGAVQIQKYFESVNYLIPINLDDLLKPIGLANMADWIKPSGLGGGIDLGFTFEPIKNLKLSGAVTDLGMIYWNQNMKNTTYNSDYTFNGFGNFNLNSNINILNITDSILKGVVNSVSNSQTSKAYTTYTSPKLNLGIEYGFLNNKLGLGLLSRTLKHHENYMEELTASVNARPWEWGNLSLSYSLVNGRFSNIGAGLGVRTGFIHWFLSADYIPIMYASVPLNAINTNFPAVIAPLPYNTKGINLGLGIKFVINEKKDADKDGVADKWDKCPNTPIGVKVDKKGCPIDSDGDGVPDYLDKCPKTPARVRVDKAGCPLDKDGDGVPDYLDKCPKTPEGVKVDKKGCPIDTDGDGVADYKDKCPETPKATKVDSLGCPLDTDKDGVPDYLDKCPDTSVRAKVDSNGCPVDTDKDGVPDYLDKCPTVAGVASNNGCPEVKKEVPKPVVAVTKPEVKKETKAEIKKETIPVVKSQQQNTLFRKSLQGIIFNQGSDIIMERSYVILNQVAGVLNYNPTYQIEIQGHTDNEGSTEKNKALSEKRALRVKKYFISKGIDEKRIATTGYGNTQPLTTKNNPGDKSLNRRVEFIVSYEEISFY